MIKKIFLLLFALLSIIISVIINNIELKDDNSKNISRFQKEIYAKENQLDFYLQQALHHTKDAVIPDFLITKYNPQLFTNKGIGIFIFQYDSMLFWSNNTIPFDLQLLDTTKPTTLLQLKNGYYLCKFHKSKQKTTVALALLKFNYPYHNQYLISNFYKDLSLDKNTLISTEKGNFNIFSSHGDFLCALQFTDLAWDESVENYLSFFLFVIGIFVFFAFLHQIFIHFLLKKLNIYFAILIQICLITILRIVLYQTGFPDYIESHEFFKPSLYAHSNLLSSLGDLTINILLSLYFAYLLFAFFKPAKIKIKYKIPLSISIFTGIIILISSALLLHWVIELIGSIIINSSISFQISNIFALNIYSYIGFAVIFFILFACYLLQSFIVNIFISILQNKKIIFLTWFCFQIIFLSYYFQYNKSNLPLMAGLQIISTIILLYEINQFALFSYKKLISFIILFALFSTIALNKFNKTKENEFRKLLALKISTEQDVIAESLFDDVYQKIIADTFFLNQYFESQQNEEEIVKRSLSYFNGFWDKYNKQIWICKPYQKLIIQPNNVEIPCDTLFQNMINEGGKPTISSHLFYLRNNSINNNYIAIIDLAKYIKKPNQKVYPYKIYIELYSKYIPRELGYPELLIDQKVNQRQFSGSYSYAKYKNHELVMNYGQYFYSITDYEYFPSQQDYLFFNRDNYNHLYYKVDSNYALIISKRLETYFNAIAPFSYLFIFYFLIIHILLALQWLTGNIKIAIFNLSTKIQLSLVIIIVLSFLFIGSMSVYYIINLYENKNISAITEKAHSVMIELEQKFAGREELNYKVTDYLNSLLLKFQNIFFTDIHVFNPQGKLLGTSKPQIFEDGLISTRMNIIAFQAMKLEQKSFFIQKENIGKLRYSSVYIPLRNNSNKIIAFINLPYFGKQSELKNEISEFIVSFINIYVLLIAIAVLIALLISNQITLPLQLLRQSFGNINLNKTNQKIQWDKKDEIGVLIAEYNRMIDELAMSAELLAKSERESAWREMAKQVAHEIKNPLTPMKLSVQHLQKAWNDKPEKWDERLEKFTQTMIAQIDALSRIATEFSNFAKMPVAQFEKIELIKFIKDISALYVQYEQIKVVFEPKMQECYIKSDNKQLVSVFNNLFKNSIQASSADKELLINIQIEENKEFCTIHFTDNGCGIPEELHPKIFSPNFTTKSGGMGLGLAMVKSIIENAGGFISFKSGINQGTTFEIKLPVSKKQ